MFAATGALALSGCASGTNTSTQSSAPASGTAAASAEKVDEIANTVPEDIKSSGKLIVGVNIPYTPNEFKDESGKIVGFDSFASDLVSHDDNDAGDVFVVRRSPTP